MKKKQPKLYLQQKKRYLKKIVGTTNKPRLAVFRSHKHIYAQLIDDVSKITLTSSSSLIKEIKEKNISTSTQECSFLVGQYVGKQAIEKNITTVVFDRGARPYHGRIKQLAEGARSAGLIF